MLPRPPTSTLFPYTTLFRSVTTLTTPSGTPASKEYSASLKVVIGVSSEGLTTDRKSTRLNSSHRCISYAVFCLKKKKKKRNENTDIAKKQREHMMIGHAMSV